MTNALPSNNYVAQHKVEITFTSCHSRNKYVIIWYIVICRQENQN